MGEILDFDRPDPEPWWSGEGARRLERSVLGSCMVDGNLTGLVVDEIIAADFMGEAHRCIWEAILVVWASGVVPDLILVGHELERQGRVERAGGWAYVSMLVDNIPCVDSAADYAKRLKECSVMRRARR